MQLLPIAALGTLLLPSLFPKAQEPEVAEPPAVQEPVVVDEVERVLDALQILDSVAFRFSGEVSRRQSEREEDDRFGGMMNISFGSMSGEGTPFSGAFSGYRYDGGSELVVLSKDRLPGFRAWLGKKQIVETLVSDGPLNTKRALTELGSVLDAGHLERYAKKTTWTGLKLEDGTTKLTGTLDAKAIKKPKSNGMVWFNEDKVLRIEASLVVDAENWIQSATFEIVRNDPMAGMGFEIMAGDPDFDDDDDEGDGEDEEGVIVEEIRAPVAFGGMGEEGETVDGEITTWALKFEENAPQKAVVQFRERVAAHLDSEDL